MPQQYLVFTFAPVQGFIEKSRKLRDLYGASRILSHLSDRIVSFAENNPSQFEIISPALVRVSTESDRGGIPNRILLKVTLADSQSIAEVKDSIKSHFTTEWQRVLIECKTWVERKLSDYYPPEDWAWNESWSYWEKHAWELFFGVGDTIATAMQDLENGKLQRDWTGINWVGESSSLTGTDGIAFPGLENRYRDPKNIAFNEVQREIEQFYRYLAFILDNPQYRQRNLKEISPKVQPEGRYIAANEKLSIPDLTKRLVTYHEIASALEMPQLKSFSELKRKAEDNTEANIGQWTGWFMGDGDKVGDYLIELSQETDSDGKIKEFSQMMRAWGQDFYQKFPEDLGRVVYAGGDDFLGVIYNKDFPKLNSHSIDTIRILNWLKQLPEEWKKEKSEEIQQKITLSLGFVWAAPAVPQRDILQHCREAERRSKLQGRDRVTIRILFANGQYVQWTTPWYGLLLLTQYQDREGIQYVEEDFNRYQNRAGQRVNAPPNWGHVYGDLAQLKARRAIDLSLNPKTQIDLIDPTIALQFFDLYFPGQATMLNERREEYTGRTEDWWLIRWINDLINVGWLLCDRFRL